MKGQQLPPDDDPGPRVGPSHPSDSSINHLVTGNHNPSYLAGGPENCLTCLTQDGAGIRSRYGTFKSYLQEFRKD